jgi:8-oxo-dGTP pyrophosphatase MutT (NUDIX family)
MSKEYTNPWTTLSTRKIYENRWIAIEEHQVINPSGGEGIYGMVHFQSRAIGIIPIDADGNTWLVGQWRYPLGEWSWEIPEGGAAISEDPLIGAKRELKEETGLTAGKWTVIQRTHLSNSVSDEEGFIFLAENLEEGESDPEETEQLQIMKLPVADAIQMVLDGRITDSLSVMGLLKVARLREV